MLPHPLAQSLLQCFLLPLLIPCSLFVTGCATDKTAEVPPPVAAPTVPAAINQPWFGMTPTQEPTLLAPELLGSPSRIYNSSFSPDGRSFAYTLQLPGRGVIAHTTYSDANGWSVPRVADFSGEHSEYDPLWSPDGSELWFSSERPLMPGSPTDRTYLWRVRPEGNGWSEPELVNLTGTGDYHSSLTNSGKVYFNVWFTGDIHAAMPTDTGWQVSEPLHELRPEASVGDPFIAPDESYIIYRSYGPMSLGNGDFFISYASDTGWTAPQNLGAPINSPQHEMCPTVTADGKFFVFASNRPGFAYNTPAGMPVSEIAEQYCHPGNGTESLYYVSADFIEKMRPK